MEQVEDLQLICYKIELEGMSIYEIFTVNNFIEKLPPSWLDFKKYLKHNWKAMCFETIIKRLQMGATTTLLMAFIFIGKMWT